MANPDRAIWDNMLAHLRKHHAPLCRNWFEQITPVGVADGSIVLRAGTVLQRDYLRRECIGAFNDAAQTATNSLLAIRFLGPDDLAPPPPRDRRNSTPGREADRDDADAHANDPAHHAVDGAVNGSTNGAATSPAASGDNTTPRSSAGRNAQQSVSHRVHTASEAELATRPGTLPINPDYGFENFIIGPGNRLAHAAALAVADNPGGAYNPYFVHGDVGLGKTHLLQAICVSIRESRPNSVMHYVSCDGFINDFMQSVQGGRMSEFRHRFRDVDVLVIDDIHFLASRDRTQEEFFHTFNSLYQERKQIILSSDAPPEEIPDLEERLVSRFKWGLVAKVDPPTFETRIAILLAKARLRAFNLPDEVAAYIAGKVVTNIRELEGAISNLQMLCSVEGRPVDIDMARESLGDRPEVVTRGPTIEEIITTVCGFYEVKRTDVLGKRRHQSISLPRQICMYLARKHTRHSLEEIGGHFGGRDHTTVLHAVRSIETKKADDADLAAVLESLDKGLRNAIGR